MNRRANVLKYFIPHNREIACLNFETLIMYECIRAIFHRNDVVVVVARSNINYSNNTSR